VKRFIGNLVMGALLLAVASFFGAPAVAFFAIRSAADANDVSGLARLVDFPAVRQSLRPQLLGDPAALAPAPSFLEDPIGAVRRQFEQAAPAARPPVDRYLTPAALGRLTRGEGRDAPEEPSPSATVRHPPKSGGPLPRPRFWGVNRARMAIPGAAGDETVFTFERKGPFEWKLVHIGLPEAGTSPAR
jgi:hypothetical protein